MNLREIIKFEQLSKKSFGNFNLSDDSDLILLLYIRERVDQTFEAFKDVVLKKTDRFIKKLEGLLDEIRYQEQFFEKIETASESDTNKKNTYSEIASFLISNGIDAHFVFEEMELSEISLIVKGIDAAQKEKMEQKRFWTFYQILPQIDAKKIRNPKDLILFPWEEIEKENADQQIEKESAEMFLKLQKKYKNGES